MRPTNSPPRTATILTLLIVLLLSAATVIGLFVPGFYRDTTWAVPQMRGQDLITLVSSSEFSGVVEKVLSLGEPQKRWFLETAPWTFQRPRCMIG
jgi:hypothetical protein